MNYTDDNRGTIQYKDRARQLIDYHNMRLPYNITPTDSDGEIEFRDKAWIFFEIKQEGKGLPEGQSLAFQRKINDIERGGKEAVLFVAEHDVIDPEIDIDAAACHVRTFFYKGEWHDGNGWNLKEYVSSFLKHIEPPSFMEAIT